MKKKTCSYLDSNINGDLHIINDKIYACYPRNVPLVTREDIDFSNISAEEIQGARKALFDGINDGTRKECNGCKCLIEKEDSQIDVGKIANLVLHPYTTCNLRCSYCVLSEEKLSAKLPDEKAHVLPILKNFYEQGLLKEDYSLGLGGGEPMLAKDLKEIIEYMDNDELKRGFCFISNSSVSSKCDYVIESLKGHQNVIKSLHISIDAGTCQTYKKMRNRDLFNQAVENIVKFAQNGIFDEITLKYIFTDDNSNSSDADILGFAEVVRLVKENNLRKTSVIIDADMKVQRENSDDYIDSDEEFQYVPLNDKMLEAVGKLYYFLTRKVENVKIKFVGGRLNAERSDVGAFDIKRIKLFAQKYEEKQLPIIQKIFSVKNQNEHKVIRIVGFKIKLRRKGERN